MFKILIGSDIVPTPANVDLFAAGDVTSIIGEDLVSVLGDADFRIFNLETPVYDGESPIPKCGPNLIAATKTMPGIKAINPSLLALANNHVLDHGDEGLYETFRQLDKWEIPYMGAGKNLAEAQKPYIIEADGKKIGIYNAAEHEFTIAEENKAGANPFDLLDSPDHIAKLKTECDFVIVLYHGGKEHYRYPSPYLQKVCRKIVDKGADLVVCQHSHCVGCQEEYKDRTIVYGQGNFVFSKNYDNEFWQTSVLVEVEIADTLKINYIPVCLHEQGTRIADETKANEIMEGFNRRSEEIKKPGFIYNTYKDFCFYNMKWYLYAISGGETNLKRSYAEYEPNYEATDCLLMINYLECEPHREILTTLSHELAKEKLKEN